MPLRTGYENIVAHKVDKAFAFPAKDAGRVIDKKDNVVIVEYKDGTKEAIE